MPLNVETLPWDRHFFEIRRLYLKEKLQLKQLIIHFELVYEFNATKSQWVKKLDEWKLTKNLDRKGWHYVYHQVRKRRLAGKDTAVFLAGARLPSDQVQKAFQNHRLTFESVQDMINPLPSPLLPADSRLNVRTPPPLWVEDEFWPDRLPWFEFQADLSRIFDLLGHQSIPIFPMPYMGLIDGSTPQLRLLGNWTVEFLENMGTRRDDIARILNQLNAMLPEKYQEDHISRAKSLCQKGGRENVQQAAVMIETLLFLLSNNVCRKFLDPNYQDRQFEKKEDQAILQFYRNSGLMKPYLTRLLRSNTPTSQALVGRLFTSCIRVCDVESLQDFIKSRLVSTSYINRMLNLGQNEVGLEERVYFRIARPLHFALARAHDELVMLLLRHGADPALSSRDDLLHITYSTLAFAAYGSRFPGGLQLLEKILKLLPSISEKQLLQALHVLKQYELETTETANTILLDALHRLAPNTMLNDPMDALVHAIRGRHEMLIDLVLAQHCDTHYSYAVLQEAVRACDAFLCETFLKAGVKPDPPPNDEYCDPWPLPSALQLAAHSGRGDILQLLLRFNADINRRRPPENPYRNPSRMSLLPMKTLFGRTALESAVRGNSVMAVQLLRNGGASALEESVGIAIYEQKDEIRDILINYGAQWIGPTDDYLTPLAAAVLVKESQLIDRILASTVDKYDSVALAAAVFQRPEAIDIIERLLERRKKLQHTCITSTGQFKSSTTTYSEKIAMDLAIRKGLTELTELLLKSGIRAITIPTFGNVASLDEKMFVYQLNEQNGLSLFSFIDVAITARAIDIVHLLLRYSDNPRTGALVTAACLGDLDTLKILLAAGEDINERGCLTYLTPLKAAIQGNKPAVVEFLLQNGADVNDPDSLPTSSTALQAACQQGDLELVKRLIVLGADINAPGSIKWGKTALQSAASEGFLGISRFLIERGADCNAAAAAKGGRTALEGAAENGHIDMVRYLLDMGTQTEGDGSPQYFRAILLAEESCEYAAAELLKNYRTWTVTDHQAYERLRDFGPRHWHYGRGYMGHEFSDTDESSDSESDRGGETSDSASEGDAMSDGKHPGVASLSSLNKELQQQLIEEKHERWVSDVAVRQRDHEKIQRTCDDEGVDEEVDWDAFVDFSGMQWGTE